MDRRPRHLTPAFAVSIAAHVAVIVALLFLASHRPEQPTQRLTRLELSDLVWIPDPRPAACGGGGAPSKPTPPPLVPSPAVTSPPRAPVVTEPETIAPEPEPTPAAAAPSVPTIAEPSGTQGTGGGVWDKTGSGPGDRSGPGAGGDGIFGKRFGLLGFADENWRDGAQSLVFAFGAGVYRERGYGFTGTIIHEVGHHIGLAHPHDGFDPETGVDFDAAGEFFFAWAGDESETVMHHLTLSNEFGEHNRDNMYRWETAGYLNWANALAGDILDHPNAPAVFVKLIAADAQAAIAKAKLDRWNYLEAVEQARASYLTLVSAADDLGVSSARLAAARRVLPQMQIRKYVCRPRQLVERLPRERI